MNEISEREIYEQFLSSSTSVRPPRWWEENLEQIAFVYVYDCEYLCSIL